MFFIMVLDPQKLPWKVYGQALYMMMYQTLHYGVRMPSIEKTNIHFLKNVPSDIVFEGL